jgi:hypothetical protein
MQKTLLLILALLTITPIAKAQLGIGPVIPQIILDQNSHSTIYTPVSSTQTAFIFPQPPWNLTDTNHSTDQSILNFNLNSYITESEQSDHTVGYTATFVYNQTHTFELDMLYTKTPTFFFGIPYWVIDYTFYADGVISCHTTLHQISTFFYSSRYPTGISFTIHYEPTSLFGGVGNIALTQTGNNLSFSGTGIHLVGGPPGNEIECFPPGVVNGLVITTPIQNATWNVTDLQTPILLYLNVTDTRLYTTSLTWQASTTHDTLLKLNALNALGKPPDCSSFFKFLSNCLNPFDIIAKMFSFVGTLIEKLLSPFGSFGITLKNLIVYPLQMFVDLLGLLSIVFLNSGSNHGVAGGFWMLLVYASSIGALYDAGRGFNGYFLRFPAFFFIGALYLMLKGAYFLFWVIPAKAFDLASRLLNALTNLVP